MRCSQFMGLTKEAVQFLKENEVLYSEIYANANNEEMDAFPDPPLRRYLLKDWKVVKEVIQAAPWSSGPCFFLCLEDDKGKMFEWSEEAIDNA